MILTIKYAQRRETYEINSLDEVAEKMIEFTDKYGIASSTIIPFSIEGSFNVSKKVDMNYTSLSALFG